MKNQRTFDEVEATRSNAFASFTERLHAENVAEPSAGRDH